MDQEIDTWPRAADWAVRRPGRSSTSFTERERLPVSASAVAPLTGHPMSTEVLLLDGDGTAAALAASLRDNGVLCRHVTEPSQRVVHWLQQTFDAAIVDDTVTEHCGLGVLERLREKSTLPVIILTKPTATARASYLEAGADDCLSKPISPRELLARLRAILRRRHAPLAGAFLAVGDLHIDFSARNVSIGRTPIELTPVEFDLLAALARRAGRVVPRRSLLSFATRRKSPISERSIDVHVAHLRKKLQRALASKRLIGTVRGVGYVLAAG